MLNKLQPHDCDQVIALAYQALDGELSTEEMEGFLFELNRCSCCFNSFELEKSFRAFLVNRIERRFMPDSVQTRIRQELLKAIQYGESPK